jgi:hypothetical protein
MFEKEYTFLGKHSQIVKSLTDIRDDGIRIFRRNIDVFMMAPLVGFLYQHTSKKDNTLDSNTKIFAEQLVSEKLNIQFVISLLVLLSILRNDFKELALLSFNPDSSPDEIEVYYEQYLLGGIEILNDKILHQVDSNIELLNVVHDFFEEFHDRYYNDLDRDELLKLCRS